MNEVFENNAAITSIRNFYMNYRKAILGIAVLVILIISVFLINNQISFEDFLLVKLGSDTKD
mgnify:CR=1 FL=1